MIKDCPACGLANSDSAQQCDCGYHFEKQQRETPIQPHSGNPIKRQKALKNFDPVSEYASYYQVPFYRKRWFFVLTFFYFAPLSFLVGISGEIYALQFDQVVKLKRKTRINMSWWALLIFLTGIIKIINILTTPSFFN